MPESPPVMVLRSFHLPADMDEELRHVAYELRRAKADVLREFLEEGLVRYRTQGSRRVQSANYDSVDRAAHADGYANDQDLARAQRYLSRDG